MEETNVRVAARIRPLLPCEKAQLCCNCVDIQNDQKQVVVGGRRAFAFDVALGTESTQEEVYDQCVISMLDGCMEGYNATVLAYGQTGSGKTYTMGMDQISKAPRDETEMGIAPRMIRDSFAKIESFEGERIMIQASCCFIEIYNDEIQDLLQPSTSKPGIVVRETADGVIQLTGIQTVRCHSEEDMLRCLRDGTVRRTTGATLMNEQSSRSHSIFTVIFEKCTVHEAPRWGSFPTESSPSPEDMFGRRESYCTAKFHLVDLAGSERAKRTGAVGTRFKESVCINGGLLALGNVISALGDPAKRGQHVPYRESKLTRLLQDSLGGNSRTVMLACASPADSDFEETLSTLKYAHRARNIKNKPVVNKDPKMAQVALLLDENEALRRQLRKISRPSPDPTLLCPDDTKTALTKVVHALVKHLPAVTGASGERDSPHLGESSLSALNDAFHSAQRALNEVQDQPSDEAAGSQGNVSQHASATDLDEIVSAGKGCSKFSAMRKDSVQVIKRIVDDNHKLEGERWLYRSKIKQLEHDLRLAKEDLQKDEEIFQERMLEMDRIMDENERLRKLPEGGGCPGGECTDSGSPLVASSTGGDDGNSQIEMQAGPSLPEDVESRSRKKLLESAIDQFVQQHELIRSLQKDAKKRDALRKKREQYLGYQQELQSTKGTKTQADTSESQDIDEVLEALQEEFAFREAKILETKRTIDSAGLSSFGTGAADFLGSRLYDVSLPEMKQLLGHCCEQMAACRYRDKHRQEMLSACKAQARERTQQVFQLRMVVKAQAKQYQEELASMLQHMPSLRGAQGASFEPEVRSVKADADVAKNSPVEQNTSALEEEIRLLKGQVTAAKQENEFQQAKNRDLKRQLRNVVVAHGSRIESRKQGVSLQTPRVLDD